jgi:cysteine desulfurase
MRKIYFDYAAATPIDKKVLKAMRPFARQLFYNPSALYQPGRAAKQALETARGQIAAVLGAKSSEIIFTAGGSEANNLAIQGILGSYPEANAVISQTEHASLAEISSSRLRGFGVAPTGQVDLTDLQKAIDDQTVAVSLSYANNEIGAIQPLAVVSQVLRSIRTRRLRAGNQLPLYLHTDASQAANYLDLHVNRLGVDLMTLNGAKLYGPKQSGALYVKKGLNLEPLVYGGGQEKGLRAGTQSLAAAVGLATALSLAQSQRQGQTARLSKLRDNALKAIMDQIPCVELNGQAKHRLANNLNLSIEGVSGEVLLHRLDAAGILVATGAACSANKQQPSATLQAIGLSPAAIDSSIRISLGRPTTKQQVAYLVKVLTKTVKQLRQA